GSAAEYPRNCGWGGVKCRPSARAERHGVVITFVGGTMVPRPFEEMIDPQTKKMRPRLVDVSGETYEVARRYMIRLERSDFEKPEQLERLATVVKMSPEQFRQRFGYIVQ